MFRTRPKPRRWIFYFASAALILAACRVFDNPKMQEPMWLIPYLSGAANWEPGNGWQYDWTATSRFRELPAEDQEQYRAPRSENLEPYTFQPVGFLYVVIVARGLFFWQGDLAAVESLHICVYILTTLWIISRLSSWLDRIVFLGAYGVNPLVIHVVTYPYYYLWQTLPAAIVAVYLLDRRFRCGRAIYLVAVVLAAVYVIRPTVIAVSLLAFWLEGRRGKTRSAVVAAIVFLLCAMVVFPGNDHEKDPWLAIYQGIGAYPNPDGISILDEFSREQYRIAYGTELNAREGGNYYQDREIRDRYRDLIRQLSLEQVKAHPLIFVRSGILNLLQSFSVGYDTRRLWVSYLSSAFGGCVLGLLIWRRMFGFIAAIVAYGITFVPYFPPLPMYQIGNYLLLSAAFVTILGEWPVYQRWRKAWGVEPCAAEEVRHLGDPLATPSSPSSSAS